MVRIKKNKPIRLEKKISMKDRLRNWYVNNRFYLFIFFSILGMILFVYLLFTFAPGTESGVYYNNHTGGV